MNRAAGIVVKMPPVGYALNQNWTVAP